MSTNTKSAMIAKPNAQALPFLARFEGLAARLPGGEERRRESAGILRERGLPGLREEAWRYTSLAPLADLSFHEALTEASGFGEPIMLPLIGALEGLPRLVFVDGRYAEALSTPGDLVKFRTFAEAPDFGTLAKPASERMVALNTMLAEDGAVIEVPDGVDAGAILLLSQGGGLPSKAVAFHPRHAIRLGAGSKLTVIEISVGRGVYLHNPVTEIVVAESASLNHVRLQDEASGAFHLATIYADIATNAAYDSFTLTLGGRISRSEIHLRLSGPFAHAAANAAQVLRGIQHGDFTTVVSHDAPDCASRQTVKNVLAGHARGVFQGRIEVARAAQHTDGYQMNQALLLSPDAEIDCKPQLEIFADDVKCSHGATVGELDADQLFYLASRGIPREEARAILVRAFLSEAIDMVLHEGAREMLEHALERWWEREAA